MSKDVEVRAGIKKAVLNYESNPLAQMTESMFHCSAGRRTGKGAAGMWGTRLQRHAGTIEDG